VRRKTGLFLLYPQEKNGCASQCVSDVDMYRFERYLTRDISYVHSLPTSSEPLPRVTEEPGGIVSIMISTYKPPIKPPRVLREASWEVKKYGKLLPYRALPEDHCFMICRYCRHLMETEDGGAIVCRFAPHLIRPFTSSNGRAVDGCTHNDLYVLYGMKEYQGEMRF
jgi:hypothetical protein